MDLLNQVNFGIKRSMFNDVYFPYLFDYSRRYEVYYGGAGSGKSVFVAQKLILKALKQRRRILCLRKVGNTLKDSVFPQVIEQLKQWKLFSRCKVNYSTYTITLDNDSVFLFRGFDDSEKIKSIVGLTDIWMEEATDFTLDDFTQLDLRLRALADNLQIFCSFNPTSKEKWVYKQWFAPDANYDKSQVLILKTTYKHNKFLPPIYGETLEAKKDTNPNYYKVYVLGEFGTFEGLVITNWTEQDFNYMELAQNGLEHRCGMDLGWVDKSAIIDTLYDKANKTIYVFNEFYKSGQQLSDLVAAILDMGLKKSKIRVDSAEPRSIQYFRNNGIDATAAQKGQDSVKAGYMFLQDNRIIVHPRCQNFKMELENFSYIKSKQTGEWTEDTTHEFSHAIDACRYAYSDIYTNKKIKTMSKSALGL